MQCKAICFEVAGNMVRQQRASKVHEDRYPLCHSHGKDEQVKHDLLDPPRYLGRAGDFRGKALSFGVLDWETTRAEGSKGVVKNDSFSLRSQDFSDHQPLSQAFSDKNLVEKEESNNASELSECSSPVNVVERNQNSVEKPGLLTSKKRRDARFSFSFSQMGRSFSYKETSSSVHASAKSGPLTFNHPTQTKTNTRSIPMLTEKNVPLQVPSPTTVRALLQFTLRKGINLFQFVVENNNTVLAATMKTSDSSTLSYTLYSVKQVTKKSDSWLGRHRNEEKNHPFAHTIIAQMKTVTSFTSDLATQKSESILFRLETNEELAAIVRTRSTTTIILPTGVHTLPKDGNAPLPLIERWKSGGACDCGGWDIGCKLRVLYYDDHTFSSFQLFEQERDQPEFKMVTHDNELHSVEFASTISLLEAFFISLAVSSHQSWCQVLIGDGPLKRETPPKYASNPPVSPIGRV